MREPYCPFCLSTLLHCERVGNRIIFACNVPECIAEFIYVYLKEETPEKEEANETVRQP